MKISYFNIIIIGMAILMPNIGAWAAREESKSDRPIVYYYNSQSNPLHRLNENNVDLRPIRRGDCPNDGILLVNTIEDYINAIESCPKKKISGYFINPAYFSPAIMKKTGFHYTGIASAATILMQLVLAQSIYEKNDFSKIVVLASTELENNIVQTYLDSKEGSSLIDHTQLFYIKSPQDFMETLSGLTSEEGIILVFGSVSSYLNDSLSEVMFESLYAKGSVIVGGPDARLLNTGFLMGVYTDKSRADSVLTGWVKKDEIDEDGIMDLRSPQIKSYMVIKENGNLMRVMGIHH
ncbi:hypothetical protein D6779_08095 [Candidatus Parcubacteria bacterium]|nr:MAG: hypothetical protein D6779_08095 [Candidatus Parcubacteria bacterium]